MELGNNSVIVDYKRNEKNGNISFKRESHSTLYACGPWILEERTVDYEPLRVRLINIETGKVDYVINPSVYVNYVTLYKNNDIFYVEVGENNDDDDDYFSFEIYELGEDCKISEIDDEDEIDDILDYEDVTNGFKKVKNDGFTFQSFFNINGKLYSDSIINTNKEKWLISQVPKS